MFAIYCEGGQWLTNGGYTNANLFFTYSPCKWLALQAPKNAAIEILRRVRSHGMAAWLVPVDALHLYEPRDKMTRAAASAVTALAQEIGEAQKYGLQHESHAFKSAAIATLRWLLAQDAGGMYLPVYEQAKSAAAIRAHGWAAAVFADFKRCRADFVDAVSVGLAGQQCVGVVA